MKIRENKCISRGQPGGRTGQPKEKREKTNGLIDLKTGGGAGQTKGKKKKEMEK